MAGRAAGAVMLFEMVGVEFDEAGNQIVAIEILTDAGSARVDGMHAAVPHGEGTGHDLVLQDDAGIGEDSFPRHVRHTFSRRQCREGERNGRRSRRRIRFQ